MSAASVVIVGISFLLQIAGGRLLASPWWMPDLMLAGFLLIVTRGAQHSLWYVLGLIAVLSTVFSVGHPLGTALAYLVAGGLVVWMSSQWDLAQLSLQLAALGAAEGVLLVLCLVFHKTGLTWGLLPLLVVRIGMTVLSFPLLSRLMGRIPRVS